MSRQASTGHQYRASAVLLIQPIQHAHQTVSVRHIIILQIQFTLMYGVGLLVEQNYTVFCEFEYSCKWIGAFQRSTHNRTWLGSESSEPTTDRAVVVRIVMK